MNGLKRLVFPAAVVAAAIALIAAAHAGDTAASAKNAYVETDLVSDQPGAPHKDPNLKNAWGVAFSPSGSPFWVADNNSGKSILYDGTGAIQNLGVTPPHRGRGLGRALLLQALHGFRRTSLHRAFLEVTAQNDFALRLYRQVGFRCRKTIYKEVQPGTAWIEAAFAYQPRLGLETAEGRA